MLLFLFLLLLLLLLLLLSRTMHAMINNGGSQNMQSWEERHTGNGSFEGLTYILPTPQQQQQEQQQETM